MDDDNSHPRMILGVDAAWTETEPSGVAAVVEEAGGWRLAAVAASYDEFIALAKGGNAGGKRPAGSLVIAADLLAAARGICGAHADVIAVDMPMSRHPITGRRSSDNAISAEYGARAASTHSPSAARPGKISDAVRSGFEALGYGLCTSPPVRGLIEVYPHPALIEFLKASYRLPYKAAKSRAYWPDRSADERRQNLRGSWQMIVEALDQRIAGVRGALPLPADGDRGWRLKAFEDKLDAVVCAAVGLACLNGKAKAFGDADSAIWVPTA